MCVFGSTIEVGLCSATPKKCCRTYHTVCGTRAECVNEFAGKFRNWCPKHVKLDDSIHHDEDDECVICTEKLGTFNRMESMLAPCCKNGWFHRSCGALLAFTTGYYFKCPLCNSGTEEFKMNLQLQGIKCQMHTASCWNGCQCAMQRIAVARKFSSSELRGLWVNTTFAFWKKNPISRRQK